MTNFYTLKTTTLLPLASLQVDLAALTPPTIQEAATFFTRKCDGSIAVALASDRQSKKSDRDSPMAHRRSAPHDDDWDRLAPYSLVHPYLLDLAKQYDGLRTKVDRSFLVGPIGRSGIYIGTSSVVLAPSGDSLREAFRKGKCVWIR